MTEYRVVVRHVRYWRGTIHRWSNVYPLSGNISAGDYNTVLANVHEMEQSVCYPHPSGQGGGIWEMALYNQSSGGVPVSVISYFDPSAPGAWVPYSGGSWPSLSAELETVAETALQVEWPAGLSRTGKPVLFKKWFHAVPASSALPGAQDISTATANAIRDTIQNYMSIVGGRGAPLGNSRRLAAATPVVKVFYGNHQMPRGRRRLVRAAARPASSFPPSLLVVPGSDDSLSV